MKKFSSGLLAFVMAGVLPMVQVHATEITLESAIQDLQYRMTVEWDQKDPSKQKEIMGEFFAQVDQLKKQGVSDDQILKSLSASAFDPQTSKELMSLAQYAKTKKLDARETQKLIVDYANKSQKLGANWSPEATTGVILGLVLALVIVLWASGAIHSGGYGSYDTNCYNDCYWDDWGNRYCDTYCN